MSSQWLARVRMSRAVALVLLVIGILTLATHLYLPKLDSGGVHRSRLLEGLEDLSSIKAADLKFRIEEMLQIKGMFFYICRKWF